MRHRPTGPVAPVVRWSRRVLVVAGTGLLLFGLWTAWSTVPRGQWASALTWLAGGIVLHDAVLAPLAVGLGAWLLPRVPMVWRAPLRGGLLAVGALGLFAVATLAGAAGRANWSVIPQDPLPALATAVLAVLVGTVAGAFLSGGRGSGAARRRSARLPTTPP